MKSVIHFGVFFMLLGIFALAQEDQMEERWVVILSANKDFAGAKHDAQRWAKASAVPFTMRGMIYDKKGLHYPAGMEPEALAGGYVPRTHNYAMEGEKELEHFLSIERSGEYAGFRPGYYILVGGVEASKAEALKKAAYFKKFAKQTYVKKTKLFMGCAL